MLNGFKNYYGNYGDKIITDQYKMKSGLYIVLNKDGIVNHLYMNEGAKEKDFTSSALDTFKYLVIRDYLSILVLYDTNKKVASKSIHSNNYLTLFTKRKSIVNKGCIEPSILKALNDYYETFNQWNEEEIEIKKSSKLQKAKKEILKTTSNMNSVLFEECKNSYNKYINDILDIEGINELKDDDYVRIFYQADLDTYNNEYLRYMVRKVFNKDKYHIYKDGQVWGLSNADMGTNPNKPSLEKSGLRICDNSTNVNIFKERNK
jgi:CRISPR-associated protein Csh1